MAVWNGDDMLVMYIRCGCKFWVSAQNTQLEYTPKYYAFEIIGKVWWRGPEVTRCQHGNELHPFNSRLWTEA